MKKVVLLSASLLLGGILCAQAPQTVKSKLESATIMRLGAELVHTAKATLTSGGNEVLIEGLSSSIDLNSLRITCTNGVTVMGSEFSRNYLTQPNVSANVKKMADSISYYQKEAAKLNVAIATNSELKELLQSNRSIAGSQNGLEVEELKKMMEYYRSQASLLVSERFELESKKEKVNEKIQALSNQYTQEATKNNKEQGNLKLKLASPLTGACNFTISYYTRAASWTPYYDLQATDFDQPIKLVSKAKFMQSTGLDWEKVQLTLSTASPSNGKVAPVLGAWFLAFQRWEDYNLSGMAYGTSFGEQSMELMEEVVVQNSIGYSKPKAAPAPPAEPIYVVNGQVVSEEQFQTLDPNMVSSAYTLSGKDATDLYGPTATAGVFVVTTKTNLVSESEKTTDLTYTIDLPYDLLSTGSEQSVTLRTIEIPATFAYYAVPKIDKTVFITARVADWAQYNLLPGEANITYNGTYAGKSFIDPNSTMEELFLTLGNEKRVQVKREILQDFSSTKLIGSEKKQEFTYQLTVKNNKNTPVEMILKDQYPIPTHKSIVVELTQTDGAHVNKEVGTLTWEFSLAAGESRTFKISYSVKYPKDETLNL